MGSGEDKGDEGVGGDEGINLSSPTSPTPPTPPTSPTPPTPYSPFPIAIKSYCNVPLPKVRHGGGSHCAPKNQVLHVLEILNH